MSVDSATGGKLADQVAKSHRINLLSLGAYTVLEKENEFDLDSKNESASNMATDTAAIRENPISLKPPSVENTS